MWNRNIISIDNVFAFMMATHINDDTPKPISILECHNRSEWREWQPAINGELDSLLNKHIFGPIKPTPRYIHLIGYK